MIDQWAWAMYLHRIHQSPITLVITFTLIPSLSDAVGSWMYRSTTQWFADVSQLRGKTSEMLKSHVQTVPPSGKNRLERFIHDRKEWCISRQRSWGVPIPVLYDTETNEPLLDDEAIEHVIRLVEAHGADIWWSASTEELLPESYRQSGESPFPKGHFPF